MKTKELIVKLKKCPRESEVYFDDLEDGFVRVDAVTVVATRKLRQHGVKAETPGVVLSDIPTVD